MNIIKHIIILALSIVMAVATIFNDNILTKTYNFFNIDSSDMKKNIVKFSIAIFTAVVIWLLQILVDKISCTSAIKKELTDLHKDYIKISDLCTNFSSYFSEAQKHSINLATDKERSSFKCISIMLGELTDELPERFNSFCSKFEPKVIKSYQNNFRTELDKIHEYVFNKSSHISEIIENASTNETACNTDANFNK